MSFHGVVIDDDLSGCVDPGRWERGLCASSGERGWRWGVVAVGRERTMARRRAGLLRTERSDSLASGEPEFYRGEMGEGAEGGGVGTDMGQDLRMTGRLAGSGVAPGEDDPGGDERDERPGDEDRDGLAVAEELDAIPSPLGGVLERV